MKKARYPLLGIIVGAALVVAGVSACTSEAQSGVGVSEVAAQMADGLDSMPASDYDTTADATETPSVTAGTSTDGTTPNTVRAGDGLSSDGIPLKWHASYGVRPIVVLFYVPGQVEDIEVVTSVRALRSVYPTYTFLIYDYKVPGAYGNLASTLQISNPPCTVLIDRTGVERHRWIGYVDTGTLNQTLINLGRY